MKKNILLFLVLAVLAIVGMILLTRVIKKRRLENIAPSISEKPAIRLANKIQSYYLECRLASTQIENTFEELENGLVMVRKTSCVYRKKDGTIETVQVPLALYNQELRQFLVINTVVSAIELPGDSYIDKLISKVLDREDPAVQLYAETSNYNPEDIKTSKFFQKINQSFGTEWPARFAESEDPKDLPKMTSGKPIFLAASFTLLTYK